MMKKFLMMLAATTMVAAPLATAQAQTREHDRVAQTTARHGPQANVTAKKTQAAHNQNHRRWAKGQRFDQRYASNYMVVKNPRAYRLNTPPRGYHWVRSGNDAVLVAISSGIIGAVIANSFR
jgi:Ni/Co efflux regulator RcnB